MFNQRHPIFSTVEIRNGFGRMSATARSHWGFLFALLGLACASWGNAQPRPPFESARSRETVTELDRFVRDDLSAHGVTPALPCSDAVFFRRVHLDILGIRPDPREVTAFLSSKEPGKRAALIDTLLQRPEYADYWAMKWCDILRVKAEFPINLWPNGAQAYHEWVRAALRDNLPYDEFARTLLTASGSNFRVPPVNFYRAAENRKPEGLAAATALTFMGTRADFWSDDQRRGCAAFFSALVFKPTAEWKEEIVMPDPARSAPIAAVFPDGAPVEIPPEMDPRRVFADWLTAPGNPWFARAAANRVWFWLLGRGIVHEADDLRTDNPPVNPALLAYLENQLTASGYDLRHLLRVILNSATYQQSCIPAAPHPEAEARFACYGARRLDAEVLADLFSTLLGPGEDYMSAVPEPFTYIPKYRPAVSLADGSVSSPFLELFGRPSRDTGLLSERNNTPTDAQRLHLLNSSTLRRRLASAPLIGRVAGGPRGKPAQAVRQAYLEILSRPPTPEEQAAALAHAGETGLTRREALEDLVWALVNTKEFLYRH